jgi:putative inorganic carbon (HCO3(-)) transporter
MTSNNNIIHKFSQPYFLIITGLALIFFTFLMFIDGSVNVKLILGIFIGLLPLFFIKPVYFLYFIFLVTPALRTIAKTDVIFQNDILTLNFNALINIFIIFFGSVLILDNWQSFLKIFKKNIFAILFAIFIFFAALSFSYSMDKQKTGEEFIRIFSIFILFLYSFITIKNRKNFYGLIAAIILGSLIPSAYGLYQFFTGTGWYDKTIFAFRINGTFLHPATFAFYLLFILPIIYAVIKTTANKTKKVIMAWLVAFFAFLIIATLTRGAWIGLLVMVLTYGALKSRKFLAGVFIVIIISYLFVPAIKSRVNDIFQPKYNSSFTTRLEIIKTTFPAFLNHPLLGNGFGSFEDIHLQYNKEAVKYESQQAHNDYLRILIELGFFGLIIYLLIFTSLFWRIVSLYFKSDNIFIKNNLLALIIIWLGALTVALGDNLLRTMEVQYLIWGYTGATLAMAEKS